MGTALENNPAEIHENLTDRPVGDPVTDTIAFWKRHAGFDMSPEDAREAIENLTGFFRLLDQWDRNTDLEN